MQSATGSSSWSFSTNGSVEEEEEEEEEGEEGEMLKRWASEKGEVGLSIAEKTFDVVISTLAEAL